MDSTHSAMAMAKSRKRPHSRASTASIHSAATQPNIEQTFAENAEAYQASWVPSSLSNSLSNSLAHSHPQPRELASAPHQMTAEDMMLATHLQASRDYSMDTSMNTSMHGAQFHQSHSMNRQSMSADSFNGNASFADDSQLMDRDGHDDGDSFVGMPGAIKTGSRTSANNETEMRQLFTLNRHRTLGDVAEELHGNERGPNSERTRQIFAMLWINTVCSKGKGSVPRGRVYANYASRCALERITVLNPASFGKLVRVLFPGLKTRRLGVRGESKYHYVNFTLMEEQPEMRDQPTQQSQVSLVEESRAFSQDFHPNPNESVSKPQERPPQPYTDTSAQVAPQYARSRNVHSLYNQPLVSNIDQLQSTMSKTPQTLCLVRDIDPPFDQSEALALPAIEAFLPDGTDADAAMSLTALYRSHCTSLVECIRYCKEKTFFHLFTSFQGTLTMPVQKLFGHPALAAWIEQCDFVLYQRMMRIISSLTLQVVPKPVLDTLRSISGRLVPHIRESFQGQSCSIIQAKEAPATLFAALLDRALRVNLTAHAAANMLSNPANRDLMYTEWMTTIAVRKVAESVPNRAMDDLVNLLLTEMRDLLDPVNVPWEMECLTLQGEFTLRNGRPARPERLEDCSASNVLDRWVSFLRSLPTHFPYASHTDIVWCVERVGTAVLRDLTIAQGKSFGSWWVTKCWIDEMVQFMAEQGGFMKQKMIATTPPPAKRDIAERSASNQGSRYSSGSDEPNMSNVSHPEPDRAQFPPASLANNNQLGADDSGIGIRTPDEDLPLEKFGFTPVNGQDSFGSGFHDHMAQI